MNGIIANALFLSERVVFGSWQHLLPIGIAMLFSVVFIRFAIKNLNKQQQHLAVQILAIFVSGTVFIFHIYYISM